MVNFDIRFLFCCLFLLLSVCLSAQDAKDIAVDSTDFKIELLPFCKSDANYFCAKPFGKELVFSSNKNKDWGLVYYSEKDNQNFSDLYVTQYVSDGEWQKSKSFSAAINSYMNEGAFCFNDSLNTIYYTTNKEDGRKIVLAKSLATLKIHKATFEKGKWGNITPFVFNNEKYNVAHPSLNSDGKKLYFSSDMPGGFGGADIYVCYSHLGQWSKPVNLGKGINTKGNETFPHITAQGRLYFSSDGRKGLGKLDIYSAEFINSEWKNVRNLGSPINTNFDDFGFYINERNWTGYLSSNRLDGVYDQIFKFQWFKSDCIKNIDVERCFTFFETATFPTEAKPLAYEWDLGDGTKMRGLEVGHCYAHEGDYKVQLNIIDTITSQLFFNEVTYEVNVERITTPYIEFKGNQMPGQSINFNGVKSKIPRVKITDLIWDFGDGHKAIGLKVNHTYANLGKYMVTLYAQGKDSIKRDVELCVFKYIDITIDGLIPVESISDSIGKLDNAAVPVYAANKSEQVTYKVQIKLSDTPIETNPQNFNGLKNVKEYKDNGVYGYTVGESKSLEEMYPLYNEVKIKGFKDAYVVAFDKTGKLMSGQDSISKPLLEGKPYTHISGRIMSRYGDPLVAKIIIENLVTGKVTKLVNDVSAEGKFLIELNNDGLYGFYAEKDSFYAVSNFIDLRNEVRNLDIKKNIEMIPMSELNEDNLALRINNLFFGTKEYNLAPASYPELQRLSMLIKLQPYLNVEISGHTDNNGEEDYNLVLSQKRASMVKDYLVSSGCIAAQIEIKGYGSSRPLASNTTEKGRYINRRVEIKFYKK